MPPSPAPSPPRPTDREYRYIAFGIRSLDRLIGSNPLKGQDPGANRAYYGYSLDQLDDRGANSPAGESATICLIGPDGTGKSLFALHLASDYWRRTRAAAKPPRIIYASTDL